MNKTIVQPSLFEPHVEATAPLLTVSTNEPQAAGKEGAETRAVVKIYSGIMNASFWSSGFGEEEAQNAISQIGGDVNVIELRIHSRGGSAFVGFFIANLFRKHAQKIGARLETVCDGLALSIASYLFSLGEKRTIAENGFVMIHNAWSSVEGDADVMEATAAFLRKLDPKILARYAAITSLSEEELEAAMKVVGANGSKGTWYTAEEALEIGFATHIEDLKAPDVDADERDAVARIGAPPQALALYGPQSTTESPEDVLARECVEWLEAHPQDNNSIPVEDASPEALSLLETLLGED